MITSALYFLAFFSFSFVIFFIQLFYLLWKGEHFVLNFGWDKSFYDGKVKNTEVGFGWSALFIFDLSIFRSRTPVIGKQYIPSLSEEKSNLDIYLRSVFLYIFIFLILVMSFFSFKTFFEYFFSLLRYAFFMDDSLTIPVSTLPEKIAFYLSCIIFFSILQSCTSLLSRIKSLVIPVTILFWLIFLLYFGVIGSFLFRTFSWVEVILILFTNLLCNANIFFLIFLFFRILKLRKKTDEEKRYESKLLKVKEYLVLSATHTILDEKTNAWELFHKDKLIALVEANVKSKSNGEYPEVKGFSQDQIKMLDEEVKNYKVKNEFIKTIVVDSMAIGAYQIESAEGDEITVLIKHDANSLSWDKRLTFQVEFLFDKYAALVPGDFKGDFVFPWVRPVENLKS